jgi:hypothetical protein
MNEPVKIQLSRSKLTLMLAGSIIFVGLGGYFMINPEKFISSFFGSTKIIFISGLASVLFFGYVGYSISKKIFDKSPGLVISDDGINDNSSSVGAGFIPWSDINEIRDTIIANQKFINLIVNNPQFYIDRQPNAWKRWIMKRNYASFGTEIGISANGLNCNYEDLKSLLQRHLQEYKSKTAVK